MQVKDRFLKKINIILSILIVILSPSLALSNELKQKLIDYNKNLKNISIVFLQSDESSLEEGIIYVGDKRIKVDYLSPNKITIMLSEKKGMYVNHELKESQFFNVNKSFVKIYFKLFRDESFFDNTKIEENNDVVLVKKEYLIEDKKYPVEIIYEENPIKLRKIILEHDGVKHTLSLVSYKYVSEFNKNFFSLIDPYLIN